MKPIIWFKYSFVTAVLFHLCSCGENPAATITCQSNILLSTTQGYVNLKQLQMGELFFIDTVKKTVTGWNTLRYNQSDLNMSPSANSDYAFNNGLSIAVS